MVLKVLTYFCSCESRALTAKSQLREQASTGATYTTQRLL